MGVVRARVVASILAWSVVGCGRLGFDAAGLDAAGLDAADPGRDAGGGQDAGPRDGAEADAGAADGGIEDAGTPLPCELDPWDAAVVVELSSLNTPATEWAPYLSPDGLELLFGSDRPGGAGMQDLYRAMRAEPAGPFGDPVRVSELSTDADDDNPYLTDDGRTLYYDSGGRIYRATRAARASPFGPREEVQGLGGPSVAPELSADETMLYFSADRPTGAGGLDLYRAARRGAVFEAVAHLTELATDAFECCASADAAGALLFTRQGAMAEIHRAARLETGYGPPQRFAPISSGTTRDFDVHVRRDQRAMVFASTRGSSESPDLWMIERPCR